MLIFARLNQGISNEPIYFKEIVLFLIKVSFKLMNNTKETTQSREFRFLELELEKMCFLIHCYRLKREALCILSSWLNKRAGQGRELYTVVLNPHFSAWLGKSGQCFCSSLLHTLNHHHQICQVSSLSRFYHSTVGHGWEWVPGATHPKNDPTYHSSKFWYIGGILAKEASL